MLSCPRRRHTPLRAATQQNSPSNCLCELPPLQGTPYQNQLQIIHCDVMKAQVRGCCPAPPAWLLVSRCCKQAGAVEGPRSQLTSTRRRAPVGASVPGRAVLNAAGRPCPCHVPLCTPPLPPGPPVCSCPTLTSAWPTSPTTSPRPSPSSCWRTGGGSLQLWHLGAAGVQSQLLRPSWPLAVQMLGVDRWKALTRSQALRQPELHHLLRNNSARPSSAPPGVCCRARNASIGCRCTVALQARLPRRCHHVPARVCDAAGGQARGPLVLPPLSQHTAAVAVRPEGVGCLPIAWVGWGYGGGGASNGGLPPHAGRTTANVSPGWLESAATPAPAAAAAAGCTTCSRSARTTSGRRPRWTAAWCVGGGWEEERAAGPAMSTASCATKDTSCGSCGCCGRLALFAATLPC